MSWTSFLFWTVFAVIGVLAQTLLPGVDLLAAGLIVSLQEDRRSVSAWLFVAFVLMQEGMGSLPFGQSLLWYVLTSLLFLLGRWMFEARNVFFVLMVGLGLGLAHCGLVYVMASLQDLAVYLPRLWRESVIQAGVIPVEWLLVRLTYLSVSPHGRKV